MRNGVCLGALLASLLLPGFASAQQRSTGDHGRTLVIVQPKDQSTVFNNNGDVEVRLGVEPGTAAGEHIELLLDGQPQHEQGHVLHHVDRGTHRLQARVVDSSGHSVIESKPVTFYLWQASRRFPSRR
jgi:hypothetical protein